MVTSVRPFLMFQGRAEEAMKLYVATIPDSEVVEIARYGAGEAGAEGSEARGGAARGPERDVHR